MSSVNHDLLSQILGVDLDKNIGMIPYLRTGKDISSYITILEEKRQVLIKEKIPEVKYSLSVVQEVGLVITFFSAMEFESIPLNALLGMELKKRSQKLVKCAGCGELFQTNRLRQAYCTQECRKRKHYPLKSHKGD